MVKLLERLAAVFAEIRIIRTISNGLINLIPLILVGAITVALVSLPIPVYQEMLARLFGDQWQDIADLVEFATLNAIALVAMLSVSYVYATEEPTVRRGDISPMMPVLTSFAVNLLLFGWGTGSQVLLTSPGRENLFVKLALALVTSWMFFAFIRLWGRLRPPKHSKLDTNLRLRSAFRTVFPLAATLVVWGLLKVFVLDNLPLAALQGLFVDIVQTYLVSDSPLAIMLTILAVHLLWFFGIHGDGLVFEQFPEIGSVAAASSPPLFASSDFYFHFVLLGGAGATLGLLIALFVVGSHHRGRRIAKAALFPSLFNVNEVFLYGLPIIFNPFYLIPFVLAPMLSAGICYFAFAMGLVPPISAEINWTTPILLSGYQATGSLAGAVLQLVCLGGSALAYAPFVVAQRKYAASHRAGKLMRLQQTALEAVEQEAPLLLTRDDEVGETAREISARLHGYFETGTTPFRLVYQPKTDASGRVIGAEALTRWHNADVGDISPLVLLSLCRESGLIAEFGRWTVREAVREYSQWKKAGLCSPKPGLMPLTMSINLDPLQLSEDPEFPKFLGGLIDEAGIGRDEIELEIVERVALHPNKANNEMLSAILDLGVTLAIDDMGVGYSSLSYISEFGATTVKTDISLINEIDTDKNQREIVASIAALAKNLELRAIVEGVETREQVQVLTSLGVDYFQGFYFSRPLEATAFVEYLRENGRAPAPQ
jgi:lactose/cellobiose-specific phosphotransferase system IIC component